MGKSRTEPEPPAKSSAEPPKSDAAKTEPPKRKESSRDTIESIIVAFILAFLFRTFEAEAFVIPTGSMAPTLAGRHKEVTCPQCKSHYSIGASEEVDNSNNELYIPSMRIKHAACPNCRFVAEVKDLPVFKGDRILVNKFMYEFQEPRRWDVVVFKFPEEPKTNYIKRLIGLPGEKLELRQGDVHRHVDGAVEILRKDDPYKQKELQQLVYDDTKPETLLHENGWPQRWTAVKKTETNESSETEPVAGWAQDESGWSTDLKDRRYTLEAATAPSWKWLRYRHILPAEDDWNAVTANPVVKLRQNPRPQLITDFCGYNAYEGRSIEEGLYWVGDLTINATVKVTNTSPGGMVMLELVEGNRRYRCRFNLDTGTVELLMLDDLSRAEDEGAVVGSATTRVKGTGEWSITFANVDDRLCLWIDGKLVSFDGKPGVVYQPYGARAVQRPWTDDLTPVGVAGVNATIQVSKLLLQRDVYYRGEYIRPQDYNRPDQSQWVFKEYLGDEYSLRKLSGNPEEWGALYEKRWIRTDDNVPENAYVFALGENEFFMMGDNSPRSKDSRLWPQSFRGYDTLHRHAVDRTSLVGKAFFIYWPHGIPFLNDGRGFPDDKNSMLNNAITAGWFYHKEPIFDRQTGQYIGRKIAEDGYPSFRIPFYPNFGRMHRIR